MLLIEVSIFLINNNVYDITSSFFMYSEQKCIKSQKYASENGLPVLKNVLLPKTRGFNTCLEILRGSLDAGYCFFPIIA